MIILITYFTWYLFFILIHIEQILNLENKIVLYYLYIKKFIEIGDNKKNIKHLIKLKFICF